jgi:hypothetical protein
MLRGAREVNDEDLLPYLEVLDESDDERNDEAF